VQGIRDDSAARIYNRVEADASMELHEVPNEGVLDHVLGGIGAWLAQKFLQNKTQYPKAGYWTRRWDQLMRQIVAAVLPNSCQVEAAAVFNVVDDDVDYPSEQNMPETISVGSSVYYDAQSVVEAHKVDSGNSPEVAPSTSLTCVTVKTGKRKLKSHRNKGVRVPLLALDVVSLVQCRLGHIPDTPENRLLVRSDIARKVETMRREKEPDYVGMRNVDMKRLIEHASNMYWIPSQEDLDMHDLYNNNKYVRERTQQRSKLVTPVGLDR